MTQTTGATSATTEQVTVEINRTEFIPGAGWWNAEDGDVWERVGDGSTTTESFDPEWDTEDYGTPVVWAAARIRDLSCDHNLEPSVYPLGDAVHERTWLSASYENPYVTERRETSAYVTGVTEAERAEIFRLAMLDGAEWVKVLHAHRYPAPEVPAIAHSDYPHNPGALYGCPACEAECVCEQSGECVACQRCRECGVDLSGLDYAHGGVCAEHGDRPLSAS